MKNIDFRNTRPLVMMVSQYDYGYNLQIALWTNGEPVRIRSARIVSENFTTICTVSDNVVTIPISASMTERFGHFPAELRVTDSVGQVSSKNFDWFVERSPLAVKSTQTYSGDIVEFTAKRVPLNSVVVTMEPIQDLNGYDSPWPAGGGKNLFDISTATVGRYINENGNAQSITTTDWSVSDFIPVQANTTYTFTPNSTAGGSAKHGFYDSNKNFISVIASGPQTFTTPSNCAYVRVSFRTVSENVQLEKGSTATAWEPYANVCPITGRTGASVVVSGKNLLENTAGTITSSGRTFTPDAEGKIAITGTATGNATYNLNSNAGIAAGQYIVDVSGLGTTAGGGGVYVAMDDGSATRLLNGVKDGSYEITATSPIGRVWLYLTTAAGTISDKVTVQIRPASITDATYEPHQATTYPITFTSAGTVYAGTVDLVSGELVVTHGGYTFTGDETFSGQTPTTYISLNTTQFPKPMKSGAWYADEATLCSHFPKVAGNTEFGVRFGANSTYFYFYKMAEMGFTTFAEFKTWLASAGVQITYPLATPLTYNLTPVQVMSLLGENVVWSPDGEVTVVVPEYY